jgi:ABC-type oligopeptide transport system ATPase subunit
MAALLSCSNVCVQFTVHTGGLNNGRTRIFSALDNVSVEIGEGEIAGLVGESGCGKSTLARAIMRLAPVCGGSISVDGTDITALPLRLLRKYRSVIQMIFQDPYASLNPRMTVFDTLAEPLQVHRNLRYAALTGEVRWLMDNVGLAQRLAGKYPHEFSGGQRQRIAIARALAVAPRLLIADEPVSALDVSIQAQVLNLLSDLSKRMGLAILFISHDLSVIRYLCPRMYVMHQGKIVEQGATETIYSSPVHPYTKTLIEAIPCL